MVINSSTLYDEMRCSYVFSCAVECPKCKHINPKLSSFPVAPQALITGNFQHFFIHVWSSLAPAQAMGGWGEVGLKVAQGGGLYIFFLLRGFGHEMAFGRKKPMDFFGKESGHSLQPCKIGIECLERIGLIHDTIHPFSFHWIQIIWPFWKHRGVSQHLFWQRLWALPTQPDACAGGGCLHRLALSVGPCPATLPLSRGAFLWCNFCKSNLLRYFFFGWTLWNC